MNTFYFLVGIIIFIMLFYFFPKRNKIEQKVIQPEIKTKNKWLYPTDSFGKMEKGVVYDSETYKRKSMPPVKHSECKQIIGAK